MSIKMTATRRYYRLEDRREYAAGEPFYVVDDREADKLERLRKAVRADGAEVKASPTDLPKAEPEPVPVPVSAPPTPSDIAAMRDEYEAVVGKRPFPGWKPDELRKRMDDYRRAALTGSDLINKG